MRVVLPLASSGAYRPGKCHGRHFVIFFKRTNFFRYHVAFHKKRLSNRDVSTSISYSFSLSKDPDIVGGPVAFWQTVAAFYRKRTGESE